VEVDDHGRECTAGGRPQVETCGIWVEERREEWFGRRTLQDESCSFGDGRRRVVASRRRLRADTPRLESLGYGVLGKEQEASPFLRAPLSAGREGLGTTGGW
jgi:hypothetical protein